MEQELIPLEAIGYEENITEDSYFRDVTDRWFDDVSVEYRHLLEDISDAIRVPPLYLYRINFGIRPIEFINLSREQALEKVLSNPNVHKLMLEFICRFVCASDDRGCRPEEVGDIDVVEPYIEQLQKEQKLIVIAGRFYDRRPSVNEKFPNELMPLLSGRKLHDIAGVSGAGYLYSALCEALRTSKFLEDYVLSDFERTRVSVCELLSKMKKLSPLYDEHSLWYLVLKTFVAMYGFRDMRTPRTMARILDEKIEDVRSMLTASGAA